jgi:hypothetical protein
VIAEGVGSIVEHGGGRLLISFYDLPWVPGLNERELKEVREIFVDAYLHPEKYEEHLNLFTPIMLILKTDENEMREEDKRLRKDILKAANGDEKALERIKDAMSSEQDKKLTAYDCAEVLLQEGDVSSFDKELISRAMGSIATLTFLYADPSYRTTFESLQTQEEKINFTMEYISSHTEVREKVLSTIKTQEEKLSQDILKNKEMIKKLGTNNFRNWLLVSTIF